MKKMAIDKDELLSRLKDLLKDELSTISYETWIVPLDIESITDDNIVFTVTSEFQRDFIENKFKSSNARDILVFLTTIVKNSDSYNASPYPLYLYLAYFLL